MKVDEIDQMIDRKKINKDELDQVLPNIRIYIGVTALIVVLLMLGFRMNTLWAYLFCGLQIIAWVWLLYLRINDRGLLEVVTNKSKEENYQLMLAYAKQHSWQIYTNRNDYMVCMKQSSWYRSDEKIVMIPWDHKIYLNIRSTSGGNEKSLFQFDILKQKRLAKDLLDFSN